MRKMIPVRLKTHTELKHLVVKKKKKELREVTFDEIINDNIENKEIKSLEHITKIQCSKGNYNYNEYMYGMANGLILALALMKNEEPKYIKSPKIYLEKEKRKVTGTS